MQVIINHILGISLSGVLIFSFVPIPAASGADLFWDYRAKSNE